jgi:DNA (cytosine-5)-methyltransferase 1
MNGSMRFGSVCSGIEAASVAWEPLGWKAAWLSEIEKFPSAVLAHHYPDVPNLGDMTTLPDRIRSGEVEAPDLFCGGTPCQAFSVAGLRKSLDDARGNLSLTFCEIADAIDQVRLIQQSNPSIVFWENVPGVLNTKDNAFGCFLGALAGEDDALIPSGGRWTNAGFIDGPQRTVAWRVLDAQYFGVAQRRRRVFVVASARADFDPAAVLFEFEGLRRDTAPSREARKDVTQCAGTLTANGGGLNRPAGNANELDFCVTVEQAKQWPAEVSSTLDTTFGTKQGLEDQHVNAGCPMFVPDMRPIALAENTIGRLPHNGGNGDGFTEGGPMYTLNATGVHGVAQPIAFSCKDNGRDATIDLTPTMRSMARSGSHANGGGQLAVCVTGDIAHTLKAEGFDASEDGTGRGQPIVAAFKGGQGEKAGGIGYSEHVAPTLSSADSGSNRTPALMQGMAVRRLTPVECERLQGFPDGYTNVPWRKAAESPDGPRYKALGNSWAVPVVRWIGERIARAT